MNKKFVFGLLMGTMLLGCAAPLRAQGASADVCGEVVALETHDRTTTRYALAYPQPPVPDTPRIALALLPGGGGYMNLDDRGCPRDLTGNSLVRSAPLFRAAGFVTALVDAPSDHTRDEGLGGFRVEAEHARDLGKVIADLRTRTKASAVWIIGTSRGAISAVNAASRLSGTSAPDGVVITSAVMAGNPRARISWVAHSVFDLPLEEIRMPILIVGHAEDQCIRSPARLMPDVAERTRGAREQVVTVTGGPGGGTSGVEACVGRSPHGYLDQEAEVAAGIARFIRGGKY